MQNTTFIPPMHPGCRFGSTFSSGDRSPSFSPLGRSHVQATHTSATQPIGVQWQPKTPPAFSGRESQVQTQGHQQCPIILLLCREHPSSQLRMRRPCCGMLSMIGELLICVAAVEISPWLGIFPACIVGQVWE